MGLMLWLCGLNLRLRTARHFLRNRFSPNRLDVSERVSLSI